MAGWDPLAAGVTALAAALLLLLPAGYALLRGLGVESKGVPGLALALGLGFAIVPPLAWVDARLGGPYLAFSASAACLLWLRPWRIRAPAAKALIPSLAFAAALALLAHAVSRPDLILQDSGLSLRVGFDVFDSVFYAAVAQELGRAPLLGIENPVFAGTPLVYVFLPALLGLLLGLVTGASLLSVFLQQLPMVGLFFVGVAGLGLLEELGVSRGGRWAGAALIALGGDLSFLMPVSRTPFERFDHLLVFYSFGAESLHYNPWMFGLPLSLTALLASHRFLASGRAGPLLAACLLFAGLWQTKPFGFVTLVGGALLAAVVVRSRRLLVLAAAAAACALPFLAWTLFAASGREGAPLQLAPLSLVRAAAAGNPLLGAIRDRVGLAAVLPVFLVGGFGLRLVGLPRLVAGARRDETGFLALALAAISVGLGGGLLLEGSPVAIDSVQFLTMAQYLMWLFAGPALAAILARRAGLGVVLLAIAVASPAGYLLRRAVPGLSSGEADRVRVPIDTDQLAAGRFVARTTGARERLLMPLSSAERSARAAALGVVSGRRLPAIGTPFSVSPQLAAARVGSVLRIYETGDPVEMERLLGALEVDLVYEDSESPLRARPSGLSEVFRSGLVRIHRFAATP